MSLLIANCPRCGAENITFDVKSQVYAGQSSSFDWQTLFEVFSNCRNCSKPSIFLLKLQEYDVRGTFDPYDDKCLVNSKIALNNFFETLWHISPKDNSNIPTPEYIPDNLQKVFEEGAACQTIGAYNAAVIMYRLCLDLATKPLLPNPTDQSVNQPSNKQRFQLGARISWLLDNGILPEELRELSECIREDGNDAAHVGNLTKVDAENVTEFASILLDRLYTQPEKIKLAEQRRLQRRASA